MPKRKPNRGRFRPGPEARRRALTPAERSLDGRSA
jgi:hypothetical protein